MLISIDSGIPKPVYYVSKSLVAGEKRYIKLEKLALAFVIATRKMRPYFQAYTIEVQTSFPSKNVLQRPDISGMMTKWSDEEEISKVLLADSRWVIQTDGGSSISGCTAGVQLISLTGETLVKSIKFGFHASNNEAEYEAALVGLRLANICGATSVRLETDSQLLENQVSGFSEEWKDRLILYLRELQNLMLLFDNVVVEYIGGGSNMVAAYLANVAYKEKYLWISLQENPSIVAQPGQCEIIEEFFTTDESRRDWRSDILNFLTQVLLPVDSQLAKTLRVKAFGYIFFDGILYKKALSRPLLRCLSNKESQEVLSELHDGEGSAHCWFKALSRRVLLAGFYWPTIMNDAKNLVRGCDTCQRFSNAIHRLAVSLMSISEAIPFDRWGLDLVGPLHMASRGRQMIIMAMDYFTKWIEAEPLSGTKAKDVIKFIVNNICCRFGVPRRITTDNGPQFNNKEMTAFYTSKWIQQCFSKLFHPQANGQVEVTNRTILYGLKKNLSGAA